MPELRPHQQKAVEEYPNICGIWWKPRVGKTFTGIRLACSRTNSCLVIVLKSLTEQWEEHIKEWNNTDCKFRVISKETFRRDWDKLDRYESVLIDESHVGFHNFKAQLHKAAKNYLDKHHIKFIWLTTATPYTSSSWSIYSAGKLLGKEWKWYSWKTRFFNDIKMGTRFIPVQKKGIEKEISEIINRIGVTMSLSDISEQAEDEYVKEYFDLNKEQKDAIKEGFDPLPIVRFTRFHQLESGAIRGDGYTENRKIDCDKTKRIIEICEQHKKIAIIGRYNLQLQYYGDEISRVWSYGGEKKQRRLFVINGETKDKNSIIKEIEACEECVVLINSMCSSGYSLSSIDTMVFASMDFSFVNYTQMVNRIKNMDKNKSCTYIHLLTRDTRDYKSVDNAVYNAVSNKQDFDVAIFNKK